MFNAGRTQAQVEGLELTGIYPEYEQLVRTLSAEVDPTARTVAVRFDPQLPPRLAIHQADYGCATMPIGAERAAHPMADEPGTARPGAVAVALPWRDLTRRPPPALSRSIAASFDGAFGAGTRTTGVLVLRDGALIGEDYASGFDKNISNRTWSVAKSLAGTFIGYRQRTHERPISGAAGFPMWFAPGDPRQSITLDNLLRMASGLHSDAAGNRTDDIYLGGANALQSLGSLQLEAKPGTRFRYANNDTLLAVASLVNDGRRPTQVAVEVRRFLDRLGMTHTVAETDWQGNLILSSQVWSTAHDLARLGLLWLNDGVWNGERILPQGWMKYMTMPSGPQPSEGPGYGATLWLFGPKQGLPEGSYAAQGNRGQYIMVVPAHKLVIVRRGEDPAGARFDIAKFTADVIGALK